MGRHMWKGHGTTPPSSDQWVASPFDTPGGSDKYASPNVTDDSGDGSIGNPWSMRHALAYGGAADRTIWLRGGTYPSPNYGGLYSYWVTCNGTAGHPCIVRSYPGEWAKVDLGDTNNGANFGETGFKIGASYVTFRDFEVYSSCPSGRITTIPGPGPSDIHFGAAFGMLQDQAYPGVSLIDMVLHDTATGFGWWEQATNSTVYGNLIYYNGWQATGDDGHGHGIYVDNWASPGGTKTIRENVIFRNFGVNFHSYNESGQTQINMDIQGNALFSSGMYSAHMPQRSFLLGGDGTPAADSTDIVHSNYLYDSASPGTDFQLGYYTHTADSPDCKDNFLPRIGCQWISGGSSAGITGNILTHTEGDVFDIGVQNTFRSKPLTGLDVFVRANTNEAGRANILVYNWDLASTVSVDISSVFTVGWNYAIFNAQNIHAGAIASGTYSGANITLPMTSGGGLSQAAPSASYPTPPATWPEFNVFLLRRT
jgi:hypothetical protein